MKFLSNFYARCGLVVTGAAVSVAAHAEPVDFTPLTAGIDWSTVIAAVMAIALSVVGVYVAIKGVKIVMGMIKSA